MKKTVLLATLVGSLALLVSPPAAQATHIVAPASDILRPSLGPTEGYLDFCHSLGGCLPGRTVVLGPPTSTSTNSLAGLEEFTGFTRDPILATGDTNDFPVDNGLTHGDRADFDWVVENRAVELAGGGNHPDVVGALTWHIGATTPSAHLETGDGVHGHISLLQPPCRDGSLNLCDPDFTQNGFRRVDVFSVISRDGGADVSDTSIEFVDPSGREAALDYILGFCDALTCVEGTPVAVFIPGWHPVATSDDFIARWQAPDGFKARYVVIDPLPENLLQQFGHDNIVQIDAVKAVPLPSSVLLVGFGLAGLAAWRARRRG